MYENGWSGQLGKRLLAGESQFSEGKEEGINGWKVGGEQGCSMPWLIHEEDVLKKKKMLLLREIQRTANGGRSVVTAEFEVDMNGVRDLLKDLQGWSGRMQIIFMD